MDFVVLRVFPVLLLGGALWLAWRELSQSIPGGLSASPQGQKLFRVRKARRVGGSIVLGLVGLQIWTGQLPQGSVPPEQALGMLEHWSSVFGLVCVLVILALWDTWEGVRYLRLYLEVVEKDELGKIREQLKKSPEGLAALSNLEPSE